MERDDQIFWDRLTGMDVVEAEEECVIRRERNVLQMNMLSAERMATKGKEHDRLGKAIFGLMSQNTLLNERIKYLRKLQDRVNWSMAVKAIYGRDGHTDCKVWMQQNLEGYC